MYMQDNEDRMIYSRDSWSGSTIKYWFSKLVEDDLWTEDEIRCPSGLDEAADPWIPGIDWTHDQESRLLPYVQGYTKDDFDLKSWYWANGGNAWVRGLHHVPGSTYGQKAIIFDDVMNPSKVISVADGYSLVVSGRDFTAARHQERLNYVCLDASVGTVKYDEVETWTDSDENDPLTFRPLTAD